MLVSSLLNKKNTYFCDMDHIISTDKVTPKETVTDSIGMACKALDSGLG